MFKSIHKQLNFGQTKKKFSTVQKILILLILLSSVIVILETENEIFESNKEFFEYSKYFFGIIFTVEYLLRVFTAGYLKKYRGSKIKKEVTQIIDEILIGLENNKLINDEIYSDSKARSLLRKGYSINKINSSLRAKGISENFIKDTIKKIKEKNIETDFISAIRLCKRRRIGPLRPDANRELFYKKDMGILARSGFDFETSKKILKMDNSEFKKYLKLI